MDFNRSVHSIRPRLVRLATSQLRDEHEAEDVVQETLGTIWRRGPQGISNLDAYAARAVWVNAGRQKRRAKDLLPLDGEILRTAGFDEPVARLALDDAIMLKDIEAAIDALPEKEQAVVRLHFYAGLTFREISEALKVSMNTAASRCRYAMQELRAGFGYHGTDDARHDRRHRRRVNCAYCDVLQPGYAGECKPRQ